MLVTGKEQKEGRACARPVILGSFMLLFWLGDVNTALQVLPYV